MELVPLENSTTFFVVYLTDKLVKRYITNQYNDEVIYPPMEITWKTRPHCKRYKGHWGVSDYRMAFDNEEEAYEYISNSYEATIKYYRDQVRIAEQQLENRKKELESVLTKQQKHNEKVENLRTTSNSDTHEEQESA